MSVRAFDMSYTLSSGWFQLSIISSNTQGCNIRNSPQWKDILGPFALCFTISEKRASFSSSDLCQTMVELSVVPVMYFPHSSLSYQRSPSSPWMPFMLALTVLCPPRDLLHLLGCPSFICPPSDILHLLGDALPVGPHSSLSSQRSPSPPWGCPSCWPS